MVGLSTVCAEFSHAIVIVVYISPEAHVAQACDIIHSVPTKLQTQHPNAFRAISGDLNHMTLANTLTNFTQFVECPTGDNKSLDLLYVNVKEAYSSTALPSFDRSDHNLVNHLPQCKPFFSDHKDSQEMVAGGT